MILDAYPDLRRFFDSRLRHAETSQPDEDLFDGSTELIHINPLDGKRALTVEDAVQGKVELSGRIYDPYDKNSTFDDWLERYIQAWNKRGTFEDSHSDIVFQLLREENMKRLEKELDLGNFPDSGHMLFQAGFYIRVRDLLANSYDDDVIRFPFIMGDPIPRQEAIELCELFQGRGVIGNSIHMLSLYRDLARLCVQIRNNPEDLPNILIWGEPGTGKESLAKVIHELSGREKTGAFRAINCAGISGALLESQLFGYIEGAFTGAERDREGLLEACKGGTLQLDEMDKMPPNLHAKLFRALQEKEIIRVGDTESRAIDVLFVATANRDLTQTAGAPNPVEAGSEDQDVSISKALAGRFGGAVLRVYPPYPSDIPLMVKYFLKPEYELDQYRFPLALWSRSQVSGWHNNVRDLKNEVDAQARRFFDLSTLRESIIMPKLRTAIKSAKQDGFSLPISQAELARRAGTKPSTLHDHPECLQKLVDEGALRATKRFVRKES